MKLLKNYQLPLLVLLCIAYILLRFWNLTSTCLWFDEIFSVHAAEHDWSGLFWFVAQDLIHPPLFYVLFKIWIAGGGESLFWLRAFSVFFSILALVPFFLLCRELKLNFLAVSLALIFFSVNGSLIKYAQEVRMYTLLLCIGLFSMWLFVRYFNFGKNLWVLTFVNILLIYTHYYGWFLVVSQILTILIFQNIKIRQMMIMLGLMLLSFTPWALAIWEATKVNANFGQNLGWMSKPDLTAVLQFIFDLIEPFYYQQTTADPASNYLITVPLLLISITALVFYLVTNWSNEDETEKQRFFLLLILVTLPILLAFLASWILPYSIWGTRHLIIVFVPLYLLVAVAISKIQLVAVRRVIILLILVLFGFALWKQVAHRGTGFILCTFQNLAVELPESSERTAIYVFEDDIAYHLWFALQHSEKNFQVIKVNDMAGIPEDKAYFLPRGFDDVKKTSENGVEGEHFWIAFRATHWDSLKPPLQNLLAKNYKLGQPKVIEAQGLEAFLVEVWTCDGRTGR